jgi:hypothetical protein
MAEPSQKYDFSRDRYDIRSVSNADSHQLHEISSKIFPLKETLKPTKKQSATLPTSADPTRRSYLSAIRRNRRIIKTQENGAESRYNDIEIIRFQRRRDKIKANSTIEKDSANVSCKRWEVD